MATTPIQQNDDGSWPGPTTVPKGKNNNYVILIPAPTLTLDSAAPETGKGLGGSGQDPGNGRNLRVPYDSDQGSGTSAYIDVEYHVTETRKRAESSSRAMLTLGR
jgi:hypothetical protein